MNNLIQIAAELEATRNRIEANTARINELSFIDERHAAAEARDIKAHKKSFDAYKANYKEIEALSEAVYVDKVALNYLLMNERVALFEEVKPAITQVITKYNGKPHGPKTRDKIYQELKAITGCFIHTYDEKITIEKPLEGYKRIQVEIITEGRDRLITPDNKINAGALDGIHPREKYTENAIQAAEALIKAYNEAQRLLDETKKALETYNELKPANMDHKYINTYLYQTIV